MTSLTKLDISNNMDMYKSKAILRAEAEARGERADHLKSNKTQQEEKLEEESIRDNLLKHFSAL